MTTEPSTATPLTAERFKAFADAVVAIAMTLLILPLLEAVSESAAERLDTAEFLTEHAGQLMNFALSFVLIAAFWLEHHRLYARVTRMTTGLLWINIAWLFTIVWLPVPTAMLGQMQTDALQATLYIGTLILTQIATLAAKAYLMRHPELTDHPRDRLRRGVIGDIAAIILFCVALPVAAWVHSIGYYALVLIAFSAPLERLLSRVGRRA